VVTIDSRSGDQLYLTIQMRLMLKIEQNTFGMSLTTRSTTYIYRLECMWRYRVRLYLAEKLANVTRVSAGTDGEIMRDVIRTFQKQRFFQKYQPGQRMLLHILFALVAARPDVGYCQVHNLVFMAPHEIVLTLMCCSC
jgi:hypothetical protein